jgi:hypothetical protein
MAALALTQHASQNVVEEDMSVTTGPKGYEFTWPAIAACAMMLGFVIAVYFGSAAALLHVKNQLHDVFEWRGRVAEPETRQALIVTANLRDQLTAVATLSPRGFHPLLASSKRDVLKQIREYPGAVSLAVVDAALPDYAMISRTLKDHLPAGSIIVLMPSHRSEDVVPMLLNR